MAKLVIPNIFTPGTPAQASQMNANFEAVANWTASGQVTTDSIQIPLGFRSNNDQGQSQPILQFLQQNDDPILDLINNNGESSIVINQLQALDAGSAVILIEDNVAQSQATSAALKMILSSNANSPAILISHGTETLSLTKSEFKLINSTFKVNATQMLIPRVTTGNRPAAAEEGSVLYNSTTKQLNEKKAASGGWAPVGAPVGSILMWPTATAPEGWLLCNGDPVTNGPDTIQNVSADFSALYAILDNADWNGNLPDLRGAFVRGSGTNSFSPGSPGVTQTGPALGDWQDDTTALNGLSDSGHTHAVNTTTDNYRIMTAIHGTGSGNNHETTYDETPHRDVKSWTSGENPPIQAKSASANLTSSDTETRPFSIGLNYIIKY